jgi:hypothetical protein
MSKKTPACVPGSKVWYLDPPEKPSKEVIRAAAIALHKILGIQSPAVKAERKK